MVPPLEWADECEGACNKLKNALTRETVLGYPDFRQLYILGIDAIFHVLGVVLFEEQDRKVVVLKN